MLLLGAGRSLMLNFAYAAAQSSSGGCSLLRARTEWATGEPPLPATMTLLRGTRLLEPLLSLPREDSSVNGARLLLCVLPGVLGELERPPRLLLLLDGDMVECRRPDDCCCGEPGAASSDVRFGCEKDARTRAAWDLSVGEDEGDGEESTSAARERR
jgi:hypothetical protein